MSVLNSLSHAVTNAIKRAASPNDTDVATLKLLAYKEAQPCRDREGSKKKQNKAKNRAKAKAAKKARKK